MKTTIEQSRESYLSIEKGIESINNKIDAKKKQIERLEKKREKLYNKSSWTEILLRPIINEVVSKYPNIQWDDDKRLTPLGLMARVSIYGHINEETIVSLRFLPNNLEDGILSLETDKILRTYPDNSIGAWNDMGHDNFEINNIEQVYSYIDEQIKETK